MEIFRTIFLSLFFFESQFFVGFGKFVTNGRTFLFHLFHVIHLAGCEFIHITNGLIGIIFRFLENFTCLFIGIAKDTFFLLGDIFLFCFQFFLKVSNFGFILFDFKTLFFDGNAAYFKIGNEIFKALVIGINEFFRIFNHKLW